MVENFIGEYKISDDAVDEILSYWQFNKSIARQGTISKLGNDPHPDDTYKKSLELFIEPHEINNFLYAKELFHCLEQYKKDFEHSDRVESYAITEQTKIQYYDKGWGFYEWHFENDGTDHSIVRHLVFATYLNDVEDGGTEFLYQGYRTTAKKGSTIIFPAIWTHTHKSQVTNNQEKYLITGWFNFIKKISI